MKESCEITYSNLGSSLVFIHDVRQVENMTGVLKHLPAAVGQRLVQVEHQGVIEPWRAILLEWTKLYVLIKLTKSNFSIVSH